MIRRRLTATIVALVAVIGGIVAVVFLATLESRLTAGVDRELDRVPATVTRATVARLERRAERETRIYDIRRIAYVLVGPGGRIVAEEPSGPTADPDPPPNVAGLAAPAGPLTVSSSGDGPRYRVVTSSLPGGGTLATAISLDDVDSALSNARRGLLIAGLAALAATAAATWIAIRRGLQPIDRMVATAEAIAEGHADERIDVTRPGSEVGRLGTALNLMLDRIGESLAARTASEQRMRRFVADASHELRTPLTAIRGYAELYRQGSGNAADAVVSMERIERAATRMGGLVDDLVLLARLDQGRPLEAAPVDLAAVVEEAVADARAVEPGRAVEVAGVTRAMVTGDRFRLRQVLDNLLANVREHTDPATRVTIRLEAHRRDVVLVVDDDGPGMTEADACRAFDRFWQAAATEEHPRRGTGLGLAIVADLIAAHGGEVGLETAPDAGTRVTIRMPAADPPR